jgi:hypothetical protein
LSFEIWEILSFFLFSIAASPAPVSFKMYGHLLSTFVLALSVAASPLSIEHKRDDSNRAAYFLDNNPAGSSIIALKISEDGFLSSPVRISTGGEGLYGKNSGGDAGPDSLFSQDAVVVEQNVWILLNNNQTLRPP